MKIITKLDELNSVNDDFVLTIGNFDGVHLGHKFLIDQIKRRLNENTKIVILTYFPHTKLITNKITENYLLIDSMEKYLKLEEQGVDCIYEVDFNKSISEMTAKDFFEKVIFPIKRLRKIYLGHDFKIGNSGADIILQLENWCREKNIELEKLEPLLIKNEVVSSSLIRKKIDEGAIKEANTYLGYSFSISGKVIHGDGRGRINNIPTINIDPSELKKIPANGVYITSMILNKKIYRSITNIGVNPTFDGKTKKIETHVLDFDEKVYGENIKIVFHEYLRNELKFSKVEDLYLQIESDIKKAKDYQL